MPIEPKAMQEIRKIREKLSQELKELEPGERVAFLRAEAAAFEKKFGLDLPHVDIDEEKTA